MKKLFIFLMSLVFSLTTVLGQTNAPAFEEFMSAYQELNAKYQKNYQAKNFPATDAILKEMLALVENLPWSAEEKEKYQPIIAQATAEVYYNQACSYSLQNRKKQAVNAFEKAIQAGYQEYQHANGDTDLHNIRKDKRFIALLEEIRTYDKLYILQHAGGYKREIRDTLPRFTYQAAESRNLKEVRNYFQLDSVAGDGDELSKIVNLMLFVTENILYDGSNWALCEFDAIDLYNYHQTTGKGINCRHKAMVLNELYLAMGFKSRYVTCMPKDQFDPDCHVINCVYSETLGKWLWMDPSHGIYVTDEAGTPLGIEEVRSRLREDKPLVLNKEAKLSKEWYLDYYMAKNLYWIQCTNVSRFNTESRYRSYDKDLKFIALTPVDYNEENRYLPGNVITHDAEYFWQKPESE